MNIEDEKGFLSGKFEDWSGEPIPNGWNTLEGKLGHKKKRRPMFWWWFPGAVVVLVGSLLLYGPLPENQNEHLVLTSSEGQNGKSVGETAKSNERPGSYPGNISSNEPQSGNSNSGKKESFGISETPPSKPQKQGQKSVDLYPAKKEAKLSLGQPEFPFLTETEKENSRKPSTIRVSEVLAAGSGAGWDSPKRNTSSTNGPQLPIGQATREGSEQKNDPPAAHQKELKSADYFRGSQPPILAEGSKLAIDLISKMEPGLPQKCNVASGANPSPVELIPFGPELALSAQKEIYFSLGAQVGFARNTIFIREADAVKKIQVDNEEGLQSLMAAISGKFHILVMPRFELYGGVQLGFYQQRLRLKTGEKIPTSFSVSDEGDSTWFSASPVWSMQTEVHNQVILFGQTELGATLRLKKESPSGPFAALQIWNRLANISSSSPVGNPLIYAGGPERWAVSYRCGYRHKLSGSWIGEVFFSPAPNRLIQKMKGLEVNSRLFGLAFSRTF